MKLIAVFKLGSVALYIIIHSTLFMHAISVLSFFLYISFLPSISLIITRAINFKLVQSVLKNI